MIMRKFLLPAGIALILFMGLIFPFNANAEETVSFWSNPETGYQVIVEDDAELLSAEEAAWLALEMKEITAYGNVSFKSISHNAYSTSQFAKDYYYENFRQESGTLFLIDMYNREIYIFSDGAVYRTITTAYANTITDNVYRYASDGDYYSCASHAFQQINSLLAGRKIAQPMKYISNALLALILSGLFNYFLIRILSGTPKPNTNEVLNSISTHYAFNQPRLTRTRQTKVYSPPSSSGGSSGHGGEGHSGGGHSGGGHSGGGGGHRF